MIRFIGALFSMAFLAVAAPVNAASFDCGKARSKVEKLVCGDAELSRQDEALDAAYREALRAWDGRLADYVRMTQRNWLGTEDCSEAARPVPCLRARYATRVAMLRSPGFRLGGIYLRGKDMLRVLPLPKGLEVGYALADPDSVQGFTPEGKPVPVAAGQAVLAIVLAGQGGDACRLQASFTAEAVVLVQTGPCSGNRLGGQWTRDPGLDPESESF